MDERRMDGGDCQLEGGSTETLKRSGSEEEKTPRGDRERIHNERRQNVGRRFGWSGWFSVVVKVQTLILQAISEWKRIAEWKEFGSDPVSLKVLSWSVAGLAEDSTDIFLSQISMVTEWDVLLLQECFRKLGGVNVGAHELFTPCELLGGLRCPAVVMHQRWSGQTKAVGGASRWTAVELDGQMTHISAHLPHTGKKLADFESVLTEIQDFISGRAGQLLILGGDFNVSFYGLTDYHHVGEWDLKTENVDGHKRFTACTSFAHCRGRAGLDGDEHLDGRRLRRVIHTFQLVEPRAIVDTTGLHHVFKETRKLTRASAGLRLVQDRSQGSVCCSFTENENETYGEKRCELDDSRKKVAAETLTDWGNWKVMARLLLATAKLHRTLETKEMSVTELELKSLLLRKKRDGRQLGRTELTEQFGETGER